MAAGNTRCVVRTPDVQILIAEDDKDSRFLMRRVIQKSFPQAIITEMSDGESVLKRFMDTGADLLIVDHKIPVMSGLDLISGVRFINTTVPIILVSNSPNVEQEAAGSGINYFLDKANLLRDLPVFLAEALGKEV
ncbi:MAG: response regulator receiver protein [Pedosphaera sp.]|nr:response regulator receiver protein [Pedosphaera sp.]